MSFAPIPDRPRAVIAGFALLLAGCAASSATPSTQATPTPVPTSSPSEAPTASPAASPEPISAEAILGSSLPALPPGTTWVRVSDPSVPFSYEVPSHWPNHVASTWQEDGTTVGTVLAAGPNPTLLGSDFSIAGVVIGVSSNPTGKTPREAVEADDYSAVCTATATEEMSDAGIIAAFHTWEACGAAGEGFLIAMAMVPIGQDGMIALVLQGSTEEDAAYLEHILGSLAFEGAGPGPSVAPSVPYLIQLEECINQHGDGIAIGLIQNADSVAHVFEIEVRFIDPAGVTVGQDNRETPFLAPGEVYRFQAQTGAVGSSSLTCAVNQVIVWR